MSDMKYANVKKTMSNEEIQNPAFLIPTNHNVVSGVNMCYVRVYYEL